MYSNSSYFIYMYVLCNGDKASSRKLWGKLVCIQEKTAHSINPRMDTGLLLTPWFSGRDRNVRQR